MNEEILMGKWHELKGGIKEKWGKLTDDDLAIVDGGAERLVGLLETRYGYSKENADEEYKLFISDHMNKTPNSGNIQGRSRLMFDYTVTTDKGVDQAVADLKKALGDRKFGVLWELDVSSKLKEKGIEYPGAFHILEVCNPFRAKEALEANICAGYFLPCKVVVYVEGKMTKIGMPRPTVLISLIGDESLGALAEEVEADLAAALDASK